MAVKQRSELIGEATIILNQTVAGGNTAALIGQMLIDIIDSSFNVEYEDADSSGIRNNALTGQVILFQKSGTGGNVGSVSVTNIDTLEGANIQPGGVVIQSDTGLMRFSSIDGTKNVDIVIPSNAAIGLVKSELPSVYSKLVGAISSVPTNSASTNGEASSIAYDASYIYIKTASGWRRAAISAF